MTPTDIPVRAAAAPLGAARRASRPADAGAIDATSPSTALRHRGALLILAASCALSACSHIPFIHRQADMTRSNQSARNLIRLDAATRSGCESVTNIDEPADLKAAQGRWVAHTCNGDLIYDVSTVKSPGSDAVVKVVPVGGQVDRPMNRNARPAMPGE